MSRILFFVGLNFILTALYSQEYRINFTVSGSGSLVDSVLVGNLARGASLVLKGTDVLVLRLSSGMDDINAEMESRLSVRPNPSSEFSILEFSLLHSGPA